MRLLYEEVAHMTFIESYLKQAVLRVKSNGWPLDFWEKLKIVGNVKKMLRTRF